MKKLILAAMVMASGVAAHASTSDCPTTQPKLLAALKAAVAQANGGFALNMWATVVNRENVVCAVAFSGKTFHSQWLNSRVISAQKAATANGFSLGVNSDAAGAGLGVAGLALSTANLYSAVQPGGSLFGLQFSNPVDPEAAYAGAAPTFGTPSDPMVGKRVGGINVFGGGLGLYNPQHFVVGAVGVSGDTSCADHEIAWRVRSSLILDYLAGVNGVSGDATRPDNIVYDIKDGASAGGWGHPTCANTVSPALLPAVR